MSSRTANIVFLTVLLGLVLLASPVAAFGAGNIASISKIEGHNWRHGDIEDTLKALAFLKGGKWSSKMVKRVYFGNWLRDYSQAVDVGTLKGVPAETLRILVWILAFMSFGYATEEYEVTSARLGCYRPEEHIDNPKDYADNLDARSYDPRLRPPVHPIELAIDPSTGMKNYIANESGGWATSSGYVKYSLDRSIHYGRLYTSGNEKGKEEDLCEALRCLGQALHCLEDFSAHSNYCELALREMGYDAFSHTGTSTSITLKGKNVFPIVTGTFGGLDFLHSVLGEAQDKLTQNELEEMDTALLEAEGTSKQNTSSSRGFGGSSTSEATILKDLLSSLPGTGNLGAECERLQAEADAQQFSNMNISGGGGGSNSRAMDFSGGASMSGMMDAKDPAQLAAKIYPILQFRDRVMRSIESVIEKIPGLSSLVEKISETLSVFVFSLLAPFIRPIIAQVTVELKKGSDGVLSSSAQHQFEPWTDPNCSDPTHSVLSKDHFSNRLNAPCGLIASAVVSYVTPRIVYAWENPNVPVQMVLTDVCQVFHHPTIRDPKLELQTTMYKTVDKWVKSLPDRGAKINTWLSMDGVRQGRNHISGGFGGGADGGHGVVDGSDLQKKRGLAGGHSHGPFTNYNQPPPSSYGGSAQDYSGGGTSYLGPSSGGAGTDYYGSSGGASPGSPGRKEKKDKSSKSKTSGSGKVKDDDYYRRKAEHKARKKEREQYKSRKSRSARDDDEDSEDSDDSEDDNRPKSKHGRSPSGDHRGRAQESSHLTQPFSDDGYAPQEEHSRGHQDNYGQYPPDPPYNYEHAPPVDPYQPPSHGPPPGVDAYGMPGGFPGGFPSDRGQDDYRHGPPPGSPGRPPYPHQQPEDYHVGGGYVVGGDGNVSHHQYGGPPSADYEYHGAGGGDYQGSSNYGYSNTGGGEYGGGGGYSADYSSGGHGYGGHQGQYPTY